MLVLLAFILSCMGFAALALSSLRHLRDVVSCVPANGRRMVLHLSGWALLTLSVWVSHSTWRDSIGVVGWFGLAAVAISAVTMGLAYARSVKKRTTPMCKGDRP